jgi:hypothetical protein
MISDKDLPELENYRRLEQELPIATVPSFGPLVVSGENETSPIHRWFRYKEAYSAQLLDSVLSYAGLDNRRRLVLLDPYCGVGTTLLSAQGKLDCISSATGIERNPFVSFVARAKLGWPAIDTRQFEDIALAVLSATDDQPATLPELSSIRTGRCISRHIAGRLLSIRNSILQFPDSATRDALLVGLAASIEPLSRVRKDGRALRLVDRSHQHVIPMLRKKWVEIQSDVDRMQATHAGVVKTKVKDGDGRALKAAGIEATSVDIVLTSPPYPNNIDYSEVYKLELWLLGFVNNSEEFLRLRKSTLRSHPTSDLNTTPDADFLKAIGTNPLARFFDPVVKRTEAYKQTWRNRLALGYFSDLWMSLREQHRCLRPGGQVFLVLGNSLHGCAGEAYLIPTDLLVGQLGKVLGFELERILIARNTRRRLSGNHFLRESIIALRKPENV